MTPAAVVDELLEFTLDDEDRALRQVVLECDEAVWGPRRFRRTSTGWRLRLPRPDLQRLEYRLVVTSRTGNTTVVLDPGNPRRVRTAFGERSVAALPGYTEPAWLDNVTSPGSTTDLVVVSGQYELPVQVWSPADVDDIDVLPLLVVHDGPEMVSLAALDRYAAAMMDAGHLPAFRMMLCRPVHRDEWYAANPGYQRAEWTAVRKVSRSYGVDVDRIVVMGASLGGLTALLLGLGHRQVAGILSQSGSFFTAEHDPQEEAYPWFDRIARTVRVLDPGRHEPMHIAMTCGAMEENAANNEAMVERLRAAGHRVTYRAVPDLHNYTAWRDAWVPVLTDLLRACW